MGLYIKHLPTESLEFQMFLLDELADQLTHQGKDVIKITIGITELKIPDAVNKAFEDAIYDHDKTHVVYPQGVPQLREAISEYYNTNFKTSVSHDNVIVNVGTSAIFRNLFQILSNSRVGSSSCYSRVPPSYSRSNFMDSLACSIPNVTHSSLSFLNFL